MQRYTLRNSMYLKCYRYQRNDDFTQALKDICYHKPTVTHRQLSHWISPQGIVLQGDNKTIIVLVLKFYPKYSYDL